MIVNEFNVWVGSSLVATQGGGGRVCDAQKRGSIRDRVKQFAK